MRRGNLEGVVKSEVDCHAHREVGVGTEVLADSPRGRERKTSRESHETHRQQESGARSGSSPTQAFSLSHL